MKDSKAKTSTRGRKPMLNRSKMTLYFPDEAYKAALAASAERNRRTLNQEIIYALDTYMESMQKPPHP